MILTTDDFVARFPDVKNIEVGIRPSGRIHLGNIATLAEAGLLTSKYPNSCLTVTICDRALPDGIDWSRETHGYTNYAENIPSPEPGFSSMYAYSFDRIIEFTDHMEKLLGIQIELRRQSDLQNLPSFKKAIIELLRHWDILVAANLANFEGYVHIYPLCRECNTSDVRPSAYRRGRLLTRCSNPDCDILEYSVTVNEADLGLHSWLSMVRDVSVLPRMDIHVYGGDYGVLDLAGIPVYNSISRLTTLAGGVAPNYFIGPLYYGKDGRKMSKTRNNGPTIDLIREKYPFDYTQRVVSLVETLDNNRQFRVNHNTAFAILNSYKD